MTCQQVTADNVIERYLQGKLAPNLRDDFETHYFDCESCLTQLQTIQAIQPVLATIPSPLTPKRTRPAVLWTGLAAAATVTVLLFTWPKAPPAPAPTAALPPATTSPPPLLALYEIQPAPYSPALYRDGASPPSSPFANAMRHYQNREWSTAAQALTALAEAAPPNPAALHFAGISHLLAGQTEPALTHLNRVIALGSETPFEEEARFYRAQALLRLGRGPDAKQELQRLIEGRGDYEALARSLLKKL